MCSSEPRKRRHLIGLVLAAVVGAAAVLTTPGCGRRATPRARDQRPNVVVIVVDALRADRLECYGYQRQTSPNLDALAQEGVLFTDAMAQASETALSVPTLLSGRRPREHGVLWVQRGDKVWAGPGLRLPTLATILKEHGYVTAAVSGNPLIGAAIGVERGFDSFDQRPGRIYVWLHASGQDINTCAYEWLDQYRPEAGPLFLYLHYIDPHNLYRPPPAFCVFGRPGYTARDDIINREMNDVLDPYTQSAVTDAMLAERGLTRADAERLSDLYDGEVLSADHYVGELLERLKRDGLYDNSIIVVTADHGEAFLDHDGLEHGGSLYQELIRVPLIIKAPAVRGGQEIDDLVEIVDVAPTILAALGIETDANMSGHSFYEPLARGGGIGDNIGMAELPAKKMHAIRLGRLKLIESPQTVELYDLAQDPGETRNLAVARPDQVVQLRDMLRELLEKHPPAEEGTEPASRREIEALKALGYLK